MFFVVVGTPTIFSSSSYFLFRPIFFGFTVFWMDSTSKSRVQGVMAQYASHVQVNLRLLNLAKKMALHATSQALAVTLHFFPSNAQVGKKNDDEQRH